MKKGILKTLLCLLLPIICLSGCGGRSAPNSNTEPIDANMASAETATPSDAQHISAQLTDTLTIDADVICAQKELYASYYLERVNVPSEAAGPEWTKALEMEELLMRYAEAHPDELDNSIGFMSRDDAVSTGSKALEDAGVTLTPVVQTCVGLEHEALMEWQQALLKDASSQYNVFGNSPVLADLTENDDAYYLVFSFSYDDIPVYGRGEAATCYHGSTSPVFETIAEMLITPQGIRGVQLNLGYAVAGEAESRAIISAEDAVEKLREAYDFESPIRYSAEKLYLEYLPIEVNGQTILTPCWCFVVYHENIKEDGSTYWSERSEAVRFNAFTGGIV